jgi:hypothetical protein
MTENALDTPQEASPEKNLVVCCDGTNDQFGAANTNVVITAALKRATQQVVFYDPGVGTFSSTAALTPAAKQVTKIMGSAFGYGVSDFFQPNWQEAFWGENYARLLAVKDKHDPDGLFFLHHGVIVAAKSGAPTVSRG